MEWWKVSRAICEGTFDDFLRSIEPKFLYGNTFVGFFFQSSNESRIAMDLISVSTIHPVMRFHSNATAGFNLYFFFSRFFLRLHFCQYFASLWWSRSVRASCVWHWNIFTPFSVRPLCYFDSFFLNWNLQTSTNGRNSFCVYIFACMRFLYGWSYIKKKKIEKIESWTPAPIVNSELHRSH